MARNLEVNGERLWRSLMEMARIGATPRGGVCRVALTDLDREGRDLFVAWCREAGMDVRVDPMGNIFARRPGRNPELPPVGTGSHLDSQPTGGKFDGVYGVLAGLEVMRTLDDHGIETEAPLEVVVWTNEEGARFAPAMMGSGVYAGVFELDVVHAARDREGVSVGQALGDIGYRGEPLDDHRFGAFFEAHIEQGPVLESAGKTIGVVTDVQGMRWFDVDFMGDEAHAGPTPMNMRRDALAGAVELAPLVYALADERAPHGRATVAEFVSEPASRNTVPGHARFSVDMRHPQVLELDAMEEGMRSAAARIAAARDLVCEVSKVWDSAPVAFDPRCVDAVRRGAELMGYPAMNAVSGAGHDSVYVSRLAPTAMVFIPCKDGISHNETESATPEHVTAGTNVLLHAMLELAGAPR